MKSGILFMLTLAAFFNPISVMAYETKEIDASKHGCIEWATNKAKENALGLASGTMVRDEHGTVVRKAANGS